MIVKDKQPYSLVTTNDANGFTRGTPHERKAHYLALATSPLWIVPAALLHLHERRYRAVRIPDVPRRTESFRPRRWWE